MTAPNSPDIVIIGSGIGGLCCGALLAKAGRCVLICESHAIPGGAAHGFHRQGYTFDSGPSLYSGLSQPSANPLRQVFDALDINLPCVTYDRWGCVLPEGQFETTVGADQFLDVLHRLRGTQAVQEWQALQQKLEPYKAAAIALPTAAVRLDVGAVLTMGRYALPLLHHLPRVGQLTGSFADLLTDVTDPFIRNWLDLLSFLISGLPAAGTSAAAMAFMFADWYRPGVTLDYPLGGSEALVNVLVESLTQHGGTLRLNAHVDQVVVEGDRAVGVKLRSGETIRATQAVIANASIWDTLPLLPEHPKLHNWRRDRTVIPPCPSFMHLHLGIDAAGLDPDLACHHIVMNDWAQGVTAPQNVVLISIPSLLDPSLAPPGKHTIHAYTPGNEPYELWAGLDRRSPEYAQLKEQRSQVLWQALERVIPDVRDRAEVTLVGTPLTHARFLRRHQGSYGPAIAAGQAMFPGAQTPLAGLWCCGDSTFPGIGLPAVAASGMITANSLLPVQQHLDVLRSLGL